MLKSQLKFRLHLPPGRITRIYEQSRETDILTATKVLEKSPYVVHFGPWRVTILALKARSEDEYRRLVGQPFHGYDFLIDQILYTQTLEMWDDHERKTPTKELALEDLVI